MARTPIFTPEEFTPTRFHTAEQKAKFANDLARFVERGFPRTAFTKAVYARLNSCFGHIAEYDIHNFYEKWFSTPTARAAWINQVMRGGGYGDPAHTFVDVELAFRKWLVATDHA